MTSSHCRNYALILALVATFIPVLGKVADPASASWFTYYYTYRFSDFALNENKLTTLRELKIETYRNSLGDMPELCMELEKYGTFEQIWNILGRHILEIINEIEDVLGVLLNKIRDNDKVRVEFINAYLTGLKHKVTLCLN
jgi:hypothetical protein